MLHQFWPHLWVEKLDQTFLFDPQVLAVTVPTYLITVWIAIRFTHGCPFLSMSLLCFRVNKESLPIVKRACTKMIDCLLLSFSSFHCLDKLVHNDLTTYVRGRQRFKQFIFASFSSIRAIWVHHDCQHKTDSYKQLSCFYSNRTLCFGQFFQTTLLYMLKNKRAFSNLPKLCFASPIFSLSYSSRCQPYRVCC